jgi:hypothetical protein
MSAAEQAVSGEARTRSNISQRPDTISKKSSGEEATWYENSSGEDYSEGEEDIGNDLQRDVGSSRAKGGHKAQSHSRKRQNPSARATRADAKRRRVSMDTISIYRWCCPLCTFTSSLNRAKLGDDIPALVGDESSDQIDCHKQWPHRMTPYVRGRINFWREHYERKHPEIKAHRYPLIMRKAHKTTLMTQKQRSEDRGYSKSYEEPSREDYLEHQEDFQGDAHSSRKGNHDIQSRAGKCRNPSAIVTRTDPRRRGVSTGSVMEFLPEYRWHCTLCTFSSFLNHAKLGGDLPPLVGDGSSGQVDCHKRWPHKLRRYVRGRINYWREHYERKHPKVKPHEYPLMMRKPHECAPTKQKQSPPEEEEDDEDEEDSVDSDSGMQAGENPSNPNAQEPVQEIRHVRRLFRTSKPSTSAITPSNSRIHPASTDDAITTALHFVEALKSPSGDISGHLLGLVTLTDMEDPQGGINVCTVVETIGYDRLLDCIQANQEDKSVALYGFQLVRNIANKAGMLPSTQANLVVKCIDLVFDVAGKYSDEPGVLKVSWRLLKSLTDSEAEWQNQARDIVLHHNGDLKQVVTSMRAFLSAEVDLIREACHLLTNLAS